MDDRGRKSILQNSEDAFQGRLAHLTMGDSESRQTLEAEPQTPHPQDPGKPKHRPRSEAIDKSLLAWSEPCRVRDRDHVRAVTTLVSFAVAGPLMPTTFDLRKAEHSAAR